MLKVDLRNARPGMVLALPVAHPKLPQHMLLRVGYVVEARILPRLHDIGVRFLWVRCPGLEFLEQYVSSDVLAAQTQMFAQVTDAFAHMQTQTSQRIAYDAYCRTIGDLVRSLVANPHAAMFLDDLASPEIASLDLLRHSSTVTYISLLLGLKLEGYLVRQRRHIAPQHAGEVTHLGVGAMLHDLGVVQVPPEVAQAYMQTGDETAPAWRQHPLHGYRTVRQHIEPSAATVVLNHHQRYDGKGYAGEGSPVLEGDRIHVFARVVAAADHFDHARRLAQPQPCPTVRVLRDMLEPSVIQRFDPNVLAALLAVVPPYPPGSIVRLSDGRWGVSISHPPTDPCRPSVQIIPDPQAAAQGHSLRGPIIELTQCAASLYVDQCDGQPTGAFNFQPPDFLRQRVAGMAYI